MASTFKGKHKGLRTRVPCRVCGCEHENPRSSSICPTCGLAEHKANEQIKANKLKKELATMSPEARCLARMRQECHLSMQAAEGVMRAFQICQEELN